MVLAFWDLSFLCWASPVNCSWRIECILFLPPSLPFLWFSFPQCNTRKSVNCVYFLSPITMLWHLGSIQVGIWTPARLTWETGSRPPCPTPAFSYPSTGGFRIGLHMISWLPASCKQKGSFLTRCKVNYKWLCKTKLIFAVQVKATQQGVHEWPSQSLWQHMPHPHPRWTSRMACVDSKLWPHF